MICSLLYWLIKKHFNTNFRFAFPGSEGVGVGLLIAFCNNESHRFDLFHFQNSLRNWLFGIFQSNLSACSMSNVHSNPNTIYQTSVELSTLTGIRGKVLWEIILLYCFANLFLSTIPFLLSRWENWLWFSSSSQTVSDKVKLYVSTAWKFRWYCQISQCCFESKEQCFKSHKLPVGPHSCRSCAAAVICRTLHVEQATREVDEITFSFLIMTKCVYCLLSILLLKFNYRKLLLFSCSLGSAF